MTGKICRLAVPAFLAVTLLVTACDAGTQKPVFDTPEDIKSVEGVTVETGTSEYEGFVIDNVMTFTDIPETLNYQLYIPKSYDGTKPYALYITLPGHGSYFDNDGDNAENVRDESFATGSIKYNENMIVAAPHLLEIAGRYEDIADEFEVHSEQVIKLTQYLLANYNIDKNKVYISGYSRGGRVMSVICTKRPDLYSAALSISSKWEGDESVIVKNRLPIYFVIGRDDESFGSEPVSTTYEKIVSEYEKEGLTPEEIAKLAVLDIKDSDYFTSKGYDSQHIGADLFASDDNVMNWLVNHDRL